MFFYHVIRGNAGHDILAISDFPSPMTTDFFNKLRGKVDKLKKRYMNTHLSSLTPFSDPFSTLTPFSTILLILLLTIPKPTNIP